MPSYICTRITAAWSIVGSRKTGTTTVAWSYIIQSRKTVPYMYAPKAWLELQQEDHGIQGPAARVQSREGSGAKGGRILQ